MVCLRIIKMQKYGIIFLSWTSFQKEHYFYEDSLWRCQMYSRCFWLAIHTFRILSVSKEPALVYSFKTYIILHPVGIFLLQFPDRLSKREGFWTETVNNTYMLKSLFSRLVNILFSSGWIKQTNLSFLGSVIPLLNGRYRIFSNFEIPGDKWHARDFELPIVLIVAFDLSLLNICQFGYTNMEHWIITMSPYWLFSYCRCRFFVNCKFTPLLHAN